MRVRRKRLRPGVPLPVVYNAEVRFAMELRVALGTRRLVRLVLSERCDGVFVNAEGQRVLEGRVSSVSPTASYCVVERRHIPLSEVLAIYSPHYRQGGASDPTDPLEVEAAAQAGTLLSKSR